MASAGCAGTADAQAVSRRAAVRMSGSVRFMCGSLLLGWCRDEWDYYPVGAGHARPAGLRGRMFAGGCPGDGRWQKVSRVAARGRAPTRGFAGRRGRRPLRLAREWVAAGACPSSGPAGPPSPKGEGKGCNPSRGVGGRFRGASGTPPPTVCPGMGGDGSLPLIRPCGATFPQGGRQGL